MCVCVLVFPKKNTIGFNSFDQNNENINIFIFGNAQQNKNNTKEKKLWGGKREAKKKNPLRNAKN